MRDLITSLSTRFINVAPEDIAGLIQFTMQETGKHMKVDRCFLLFYSGNQSSYDWAYEWFEPGLAPLKDYLTQLSIKPQRWTLSQIKRGKILEINCLNDLPETAEMERALYQGSGIVSMLLVPLTFNNLLIGLLGLATISKVRQWLPNEKVWLHRLAEMLTSVLARQRAQRLQDATYQIAQASFAAQNLDDLYVQIHQILKGLMPVDNFFLALYNQEKDILEFPYYVDQYDPKPNPQRPGKGMTEYVLRRGKPLWAPLEAFDKLIQLGEIELIGNPAHDWIGVPLIVKERTIGVMASQIYDEGMRFSEYELNILSFVSTQVAMVIERKLAEQQLQQALNDKEILLREVHRRVRNNMQVVSSLISLQVEGVSNAHDRRLFDQVQSRIRAMAMVHEELYRAQDLGHIQFNEYIESLSQMVYLAYCTNPNVALHLDVDQIEFSLEAAIPCGLIIHELLANAMEHAFPSGKSGEVWVRMHLEGDLCRLVVADNGVGLPEKVEQNKVQPFGLQLVEILSKQMHAQLNVSRIQGTNVELLFTAPVPRFEPHLELELVE
jgi:two-component sensor histidine kinase